MRYQISNYALLKKLLETVPEDPDECMLWPRAKVAFGYGQITVGSYGKVQVHRQVHCLAYELSVGPIPEGLCVLHSCDIPACFRPSHLFTGTKLDNRRDCEKKGRARHANGEKVNTAKLTEEKVREVFRLRAEGYSQQAIADHLKVRQTSISRILLRQYWKHLIV